jgi:hypothetical protein
MKIFRNGLEYELTHAEMRVAYEKMKLEYLKEDIECRANEDNIQLSNATIDYIASRVDKSINNNDCYWDIYWATIDSIIEEALEN